MPTTPEPVIVEGSDAAAGGSPLPLVWVNGVLEPGLAISPLDRGFTLADGLFETLRVHAGVPFRVDAHLARLEAGARRLALPLPPLDALRAMLDAAERECGRLGVRDCALRLTVSRGVGLTGLAPTASAPGGASTVVVTASALPAAPAAADGLSAVVVAGRRNEHAATAGLKTLAYTESVVALLDARAAGADEAIMLDTAGHVSEASASNLFLVHDRVVVTPPLVGCGVLPGVTRAAVVELCAELGLACEERITRAGELGVATEAFATSSLRGIAPIVRVDGRPVGAGVPGPVTGELRAAYARLVARECGGATA